MQMAAKTYSKTQVPQPQLSAILQPHPHSAPLENQEGRAIDDVPVDATTTRKITECFLTYEVGIPVPTC